MKTLRHSLLRAVAALALALLALPAAAQMVQPSAWHRMPDGRHYALRATEASSGFALVAQANAEDNGVVLSIMHANAPACADVGPNGTRDLGIDRRVAINGNYYPDMAASCQGHSLVWWPIYRSQQAALVKLARSGSMSLVGQETFHFDTRGIDVVEASLISTTP